ncbi:cyclopropane-fatty-acyl-phospholipid synthase [mine drainage metagenome]|uniref:Cyclopropane-fatty-acyl-phospholipid synthase n=1 Tax=mine drainage metagenome TaxID=410659 RepID=A0A1J5TUY2_9ZZZZ
MNANSDSKIEKSSDLAHRILHRLFGEYKGVFAIRLWNDSVLQIGDGSPMFTLSIKHPGILRQLVLFRDPVHLAEAYFDGDVEVTGDFNSAMELRYYLENLMLPFQGKLLLALHAMKLGNKKDDEVTVLQPAIRNTAQVIGKNDRESIAFHYDVSNEFYKLWLDEHMVYSCAYFEYPEQGLDLAQRNKLDYICRKLRLQSGEHLLDIGCGWGALVCWAAKHYGVHAHGITLSRNQYEYAREEVKKQRLDKLVTIEMRNYRDLPLIATYDKVSSIGMFEHVGLKNLPSYFSTVHEVLKPGGLFLNHGITSDEPGWSRGTSTRFINRHVFPDGELDTISNIQSHMERASFEILDLEGLRPHYAFTLRHWVNRLEEKSEEAIRLVGERTYRVWRLYMTGCALQFERGATGIYQILAESKQDGFPNLPLTRRDLYETRSNT